MNYQFHQTCQIVNLNSIYLKYFGFKNDGRFVEIGAFDGFTCSNTWGLAEAGWTGLYIEPIAEYYTACVNNHQGHPQISCANIAIGDYQGTIKLEVAGILSTASQEQKDTLANVQWAKNAFSGNVREVPITTLDNALNLFKITPQMDVINIDVEGLETKVLAGFNIGYWQPKLVIVEAHELHPEIGLRSQAPQINQFFDLAGYKKIYSDQINNIYINLKAYPDT